MGRKGIIFILAIVLFVFVAQGISEAGEPKIYWMNGSKLQCADSDGENIQDLAPELTLDRAYKLNIAKGKIYWVNSGKLQCADLDGENIQDLAPGLTIGSSFGVDVARGKIYWLEYSSTKGEGKIWRANLDGSNPEAFVTGLWHPRHLTLDVVGGKMYWTELDRWHTGSRGTFGDKIQCANLDGSNIQPLVQPRHSIIDLVLDVADGKMYWAVRFWGDYEKGILYANLDGSNIQTLYTSWWYREIEEIALDVVNRKIYWWEEPPPPIPNNEGGPSHSGLWRASLEVTEQGNLKWKNRREIVTSIKDGIRYVSDIIIAPATPESSDPTSPDQDTSTAPENTVSEGTSTPFLREPNLPVGYGYTGVTLENRDLGLNIPPDARDLYVLSSVYLSNDIVAHSSTHDKHDVRVWDIAKDELITRLDGHTGDVTSLAHLPDSPDGAILASGSKDNTIRLWKRNGNNWTSTSISGHKDDVTSLVYLPGSPGGYTFASGDADGNDPLMEVVWRAVECLNGAGS